MDEISFEDAIKDVERDKNGSPIVLSPYGMIVREIEGKKYLCTMTKEEALERIKELGRSSPKFDECYWSSGGFCMTNKCTHRCQEIAAGTPGGGWLCAC